MKLEAALHMPAVMIAILLSSIGPSVLASRVVVTFRNASLNFEATMPENTTMIKQYGRRLVLRVEERQDGQQVEEWVQEALGGEEFIERVEQDVLVSAYEMSEAGGGGLINTSSAENYTHTPDDAAVYPALWNSAPYTSFVAKGWNLDEAEPYALHIQSLRSLTNGQGTTMSIIDSGIAEAAKPLFQPAAGYDFVSSPDYSNKPNQARNPDYTDPGDQGPTCPTPSWHGTKVASIATTIAPGATLTIMRVLGQCGVGFSSDIADAIVWAAGGQINGLSPNPFPASVISLSLAGKSNCPSYLQSAVSQARSLGSTVIVAAGNAAQNASFYFPANCRYVLPVGASTRQGTLASYSNWGASLTLSAPGGDSANPIPVMSIANGLPAMAYAIGTSFASPHVSGFLSLLQSQRSRNSTPAAVIVPFSSCAIGECGGGIISYFNPSELSSPLITPNISIADSVGQNTSSPTTASSACIAELYNFDWTHLITRIYNPAIGGLQDLRLELQIGTAHSGDSQTTYTCPYPCHITTFMICFTPPPGYNYFRYIRIGCSDGTYSDQIGTADACPVSTISITSPGGFTSSTARYDNNIYGITPTSITGATTYVGCSDRCGSEGQLFCPNGIMTSFLAAHDAHHISAFKFGCSSRRCPASYYMSTITYVCHSCDQCGGGRYTVGCGGTEPGVCTNCAGDCSDAQFKRGCSGTSAGWCEACNVCGGGYRFGGCAGGDLSDTRTCVACDAGKYGGGGFQRTCNNCWKGKYNPDAGQEYESACKLCPAGKYNPGAGSNSIDACQSCPAGKILPFAGASSDTQCVNCATGTYSYSAANGGSCTACPVGKYNDEEGKPECKLCAAGTYGPTTGAIAACTQCGFGKYGFTEGAASESVCVLCAAGTYSSITGAQLCSKCVAGKYALTTGAMGCIDCGRGTYSTATGWNRDCTSCATGKYNPDTASPSLSMCRDCDAGKYGPGLALSACTLCLPGTFTGTAGNIACGTCLAGTYTIASGTVQCQPCSVITSCAAGTEYACIADAGSKCVACAVIYACEYLTNKCFISGGATPSCLCGSGFEMVGGKCTGCGTGMYKMTQSSGACTAMSAPVCSRGQYLQPGSAFANAACVSCPSLPPNAIQAAAGCEWTCGAGFDNNAP